MKYTVETLIPVWINGEARDVPAGVCVASLLAWLGVAADRVAVEMNKAIVRKRDWPDEAVDAGSHIEIVEFVGGG